MTALPYKTGCDSPEAIELSQLLDELAGEPTPDATHDSIMFDVASWDGSPPHVRADRNGLLQLLTKLATDAPRSGPLGRSVCFRLSAEHGALFRVIVADARALESDSADLDSAFWVELPAYESDATWSVAPCAGRNPRRVVVYIEDNSSSIALMRDLFEELVDAHLFTARTGTAGIQLVRALRPDLVLMDIHLPDMDGFEATKQLRGWSETRAIPVIAITAAAMLHDRERNQPGLFDRYLTKPIKVDELTDLLTELFDRTSAETD